MLAGAVRFFIFYFILKIGYDEVCEKEDLFFYDFLNFFFSVRAGFWDKPFFLWPKSVGFIIWTP